MQNHFLLGICVGEAFAEYCLLNDNKIVSTKRAYLSRENLKNSLSQFMAEHSDKKIAKAAVSLRVSEKLLDYKLNGAVAHITTEGFEHWLNLNLNPLSTFTTQNLQFSVRERLLADGSVDIALKIEDLKAIAQKIREQKTDKVCLHFLHASLNPVHQEMAYNFLAAEGFEVFLPEKTDNADEVSRWKRNSLKATVTSLFNDLKKEIQEALQESIKAEDIYFLNAAGEFSQNANHNPIAGLTAAYSALAMCSRKTESDILYLGLEHFVLISPQKWSNQWQTNWGCIENKHVAIRKLAIQPTLAIDLNAFQYFDFTDQSEGWEPGPMFLGRAQKATLLDLWAENAKLAKIDGLQDRITAAGIQRFKNTLLTLSKISRSHDKEVSHVSKELLSLAIQQLAMESLLFRERKNLIITGPLADLFGNAFKKDRHATIKNDDFALSHSVALLGQSLLNPS